MTAHHLVSHGLMRQRISDGFNLIRRDCSVVDPGSYADDAPSFDLAWPRAFMALRVVRAWYVICGALKRVAWNAVGRVELEL